MYNWGGDPLKESQVEVLEDVSTGAAIVVYNDDVNTFDHVIDCLIKYCEHTAEQAEQCALIIHYKGKCIVKRGSYDDLRPICEALCLHQLSATIEESD